MYMSVVSVEQTGDEAIAALNNSGISACTSKRMSMCFRRTWIPSNVLISESSSAP